MLVHANSIAWFMVAWDPRQMITGEDIKVARIRNGHMTQSELATRLGVSLRTVTGWENGATIPPKQQSALAEVLGVGDIAPQIRAFVDPLSELSDGQLIAELARRLAVIRNEAAMTAQSDETRTAQDQLEGDTHQLSRFGNDAVSWSNGREAQRMMTERHGSGDGVAVEQAAGGVSDPYADEVVGSLERRTEVQPAKGDTTGRRGRTAG